MEKVQASAENAVEKLSSALNRFTSKDKTEEGAEDSSKAVSSNSEQKTDEAAQVDTAPKSPKTPVSPSPDSRPKSSEVRPGASWANIARGPASTPVEST